MRAMETRKRVVIVGGVAGGASCAARVRRLDESAHVTIFDRGPFVSFANCGLPYFVGDVIREEGKLLVATPELFRNRFNIDVQTHHDVVSINRQAREIEVHNLKSGVSERKPYDALLLSPGAAPIRPSLPGIDLPGVFVLRTIADSRRIREWIDTKQAKRAVVIGGGFIGLEMAENLALRGLEITIIEAADQLMPPLDPEMAEFVRQGLLTHNVEVQLGDPVAGFEDTAEGLTVTTKSGMRFTAGFVVLAIGVKPETTLAESAGLEIGSKGGIRVDESMRTSDSHIWAVGDAIEVRDYVTGDWSFLPLAGPASRQGRIAADSICGRDSKFRGSQGTAVCGCFGLTIAMTGATEKGLRRAGITDFSAIYLHPGHHAGYYPGAKPIHLKVVFGSSDGRLLGAQGVGEEGVERRIDVISMAIQKHGTVFDLEECELCYAPQYGSAKDPVNIAGMIAGNVIRDDLSLAPWTDLPATDALIVDVREPAEHENGSIKGAVNLPLNQLRDRLGELPRDREIWVHCGVGQRSYYALRLLSQHGFNVRNLPGGYQTFCAWYPQGI